MKRSTGIYRSLRAACLVLGCVAALGVCATAEAAVGPHAPSMICGYCGDSGTGWSGCTSQTEEHSASIPFIASVRHYLVVSYCKRGGVITSLSLAAHGCDVGGLVSCSVGPAWQTGGGVGEGFATFEAHATWVVNLPPFYSNYDTLNLTIPVG
jgi:hypothetical protein